MNQSRSQILRAAATLLLSGLISSTLYAQTPALSRTVIVLDPAHGGADTGARIADNLPEKDVTLAFAARLRPLLAAAGFTVVTTRDADPAATAPPFTTDLRAGIANHPRALACILIHATPSGSGVHIFTSTLPPDADPPDPNQPLPWDTAQSAYIPLSLRLARDLGTALLHANIPPVLGHASIRPLDNLTCPAVALELAPLLIPGSDPTLISDPAYQQRIAQAITAALTAWRNEAAPPPPPPPTHPTAPQATTPPVPAPAAKPTTPAPTSTPTPSSGATP